MTQTPHPPSFPIDREYAAQYERQVATTTGMTAEEVTTGALVSFRPGFSDKLVGMEFEVTAFADGTLIHTEGDGEHLPYVGLRIRVGKGRRWGHRLAYLRDLVPAA